MKTRAAAARATEISNKKLVIHEGIAFEKPDFEVQSKAHALHLFADSVLAFLAHMRPSHKAMPLTYFLVLKGRTWLIHYLADAIEIVN